MGQCIDLLSTGQAPLLDAVRGEIRSSRALLVRVFHREGSPRSCAAEFQSGEGSRPRTTVSRVEEFLEDKKVNLVKF